MRQANLKLKPDKCHLFKSKETATWLGNDLSEEGITPDSYNLKSVRDWPVPIKVTEVRGILDLSNYYHRFAREYSIIKLLTNLTHQGQPFHECELAFEFK